MRRLTAHWKPLILFEILWKLVTLLVIAPACAGLIQLAIHLAKLKYLTTSNLLQFLRSPWTILLLAVLCFGGYNVWRNQGIPFVWGSWCDWGSLQNVVDTVLVFLLLNSIRYSTPPTSITRFTGYLSKLTLGAYLVSWIPDNYLYTMLKSAVPSVTDQLNYFPLTVGGTILVSLLLAAVVECCVSLLMRLLRRSAKVRTAGTAQA